MAASLKSRIGTDTEIAAGKTGQFDVIVDGKLVFSKAEAGRFPIDGEVEELISAAREGREPKLPTEPPSQGGFVQRALRKLRN